MTAVPAGPLTPMPAVMQKAHILGQAVCCIHGLDEVDALYSYEASDESSGRTGHLQQCHGQKRAGSCACRTNSKFGL